MFCFAAFHLFQASYMSLMLKHHRRRQILKYYWRRHLKHYCRRHLKHYWRRQTISRLLSISLKLLLTFYYSSLITAALMVVDTIISLAWLWTVSERFVKDAANTSDLTGPKISVTEEIEVTDDSGIVETMKSMAGRFGRKKRLIL